MSKECDNLWSSPTILAASNQQLLVRFRKLGKDDVIVPGTVRLPFTIALDSKDANRTVVQNHGRAIVKKLNIKISGNEVMSIDDSDVFHCYNDLWKTAPERANGHYQGIDASDNRNTTRIRVGAGNRDSSVVADKTIADAFGDRFFTPLDFELLESHMPFYQSALGDRLEYELKFNDYSHVIKATGDVDHIGGISLEYDMVTLPDLARMIDTQFKGRLAILYDRVLQHRKIAMEKSDTLWNINLNVPARSMKGILMLFENVAARPPFARNTEAFYNPQITKVQVTIEGIPNQLYSQGMRAYYMWDEAKKYFAASPGSKRHPEVGTVAKDMALADANQGEFLTSKYSLWLDLRTSDGHGLHGSGRRIENASEGIRIQITKKAEVAGALNIYLFVIMDAQLNIEDERLHDYLRAFYHVFMGEPTLYIIDECSASTALTKKKDMLSMLAFSGRHAEQSVWVLT